MTIEQPHYLSDSLEALFPHLEKTAYRVTGPAHPKYNCIAHAAGKSDLWWWPLDGEVEEVFWPAGVPREVTLAAFIAALGTVGYVACEGLDLSLEPGQEKVVLYVDAAGEPTHAARQLANGHWTSKLGLLEVIEHEQPNSLEAGPGKSAYGTVARVLRRPRQD